MRIGFAGTPDFSVPTLDALYRFSADSDAQVVGVWTQPDRPSGRGRKITPSPVKRCALDHETTVHQPRSLRDAQAQATLAATDLDLLVVVAYGLILPTEVLSAPRLGCVNVHASLLPRWRGAAPIQRAIAAGDTVTGIGIMAMDEGLDTGALWRNIPIQIHTDDTGGMLHDRLSVAGADALIEALPQIIAGDSPTPQDPEMRTYAAKLTKAEATVDWQQDAQTICNQIRAFNPWPVAQTTLDGAQLRLWSATVGSAVATGREPGQVKVNEDGLLVACGDGAVQLTEVQIAGGRPTPAINFCRARDCADKILGQG